MSKRFVGYRRAPQSFISLYDAVIIDGELCDRAGKPHRLVEFVPVYEGDPGWEEAEAETKVAEAQYRNRMRAS